MEFHSCPGCGSDRIVYKKTAQTIGQVVGAIGGIAVGALLPYSAHNMPAPKLPQQALQYLTFAKTGALIPFDFQQIKENVPELARLNYEMVIHSLDPLIDFENLF